MALRSSLSPQVEAAKKAYHAACKEEKLATSRETNSKADPSLNPEQLKKLQDKVEKCKQDVLKVNRAQLFHAERACPSWPPVWPTAFVAAGADAGGGATAAEPSAALERVPQ